MALVILDDELSCSPGGLMDVFHKANPISLQRVRRCRDIVCFKIKMEVFALIHKLSGRIFFGYEFQMKDLIACPNTCVKILVLELEC